MQCHREKENRFCRAVATERLYFFRRRMCYDGAMARKYLTPPYADEFDDDPLAEDAAPLAQPPPQDPMVALANADLAELFGPQGAIAQRLPDYELRPSQLEMAESVKRAILAHHHALVEAPTGTGKSIAYLIPAILSGKTVVVSTANKALQSQLYQKDLPFLRTVLGMEIPAVVVKGRSNYVCNLKWEKETTAQKSYRPL